jgi:hypothetical protein
MDDLVEKLAENLDLDFEENIPEKNLEALNEGENFIGVYKK